MNNKYFTSFYQLGLYTLIAFHIFGNVLWLTLNNIPPTWDAALHTSLSLRFLDYIQANVASFNLHDFLKITDYYPPFVHWVGVVLALFSRDYKTIALTGTISFAIAIFFLFKLTKEFFKSEKIAFFSSFFFSFFITIYQQSRYNMLDIPLTALLLGGSYFLIKSESFQKRPYSLGFFLFFALAFLTKWYSAVYLAVPLLLTFWQIIQKRQTSLSLIKTLLAGAIIFIFVCAPWYLTNLESIVRFSQITATPELADPQNLFSLENLTFYLKLIIMFQISFLGLVFFLYSSVRIFFQKELVKKALLIFSILIFNYIFFTFIPNKNIRYLIPLMPLLAMIMGYGVATLFTNSNKVFSQPIVVGLTLFFIGSYMILSFAIPVFPKYKYAVNFPLIGWTDVLYLHDYPVKVIYTNSTFPYLQLLEDIAATKPGKIKILLLKNTEELNNGILDPLLYPELETRKNDFQYIGYDVLLNLQSEDQIRDYLNENVDVAIVSTKYLGLREAIREYDTVEKFQRFFLEGKATKFTKSEEYELKVNESNPEDNLLLFKK